MKASFNRLAEAELITAARYLQGEAGLVGPGVLARIGGWVTSSRPPRPGGKRATQESTT